MKVKNRKRKGSKFKIQVKIRQVFKKSLLAVLDKWNIIAPIYEIDWPYLCIATVWQVLNIKKHLQSPDLQILLHFWQKDILTLDVLEKGQLIQLDDVTRIKLALRNPGQLAPFACYLVSKIGNFAINVTEIICAKKFSVKL